MKEIEPIENKTIFQENSICKKSQGDTFARQGDYENAIICYNKACFVNPDDYMLYSARGNAYAKLCDFKSAISNYKKLLSIQSNPPQAIKEEIAQVFHVHGYTYLLEKEYTTAIVYLTDAVTLDALQANYWLHRCLAYIGLENWTKTLKDIDHAICIDANDADMLKGNNDIARAFKLNPNHPEVLDFEKKMWYQSQHLHDQACRHIMNREFLESLDCLNSCIEFNHEDIKILVLRASVYRELRNYDAAMADVEYASKVYFMKQRQSNDDTPDEPGELDEHIQELQSHTSLVSSISPIDEHPEITRQRNLILNDVAVAEITKGNFDAALTAMNMAIESEASTAKRFDGRMIDYRFYVNRGDCYRALSKHQAALADYMSALELEPTDTEIHTRIAMIRYHFGLELFNRGAFDKAEIEFTLAIRYNPKVYHYYIRRGDCFRYLEQNEMAYQDYKRGHALNSNDPEILAKIKQYQANMPTIPQRILSQPSRNQKQSVADSRLKPGKLFVKAEEARQSAQQSQKAYKKLLFTPANLSSPTKLRFPG